MEPYSLPGLDLPECLGLGEPGTHPPSGCESRGPAQVERAPSRSHGTTSEAGLMVLSIQIEKLRPEKERDLAKSPCSR